METLDRRLLSPCLETLYQVTQGHTSRESYQGNDPSSESPEEASAEQALEQDRKSDRSGYSFQTRSGDEINPVPNRFNCCTW